MAQNQPLVVILMGPPGSGKGTQAVRLSKELRIPHVSTGDLFRENMSKQTELGKKAKGYMEAGQYVPDELVLDMLFDRVSKPDAKQGYLLDGFPRTLPQAQALDKHLEGKSRVIALNLDVPDEEIVKRIAGRLTCKNCGHMHNRFFSPPENDDMCDLCEGELTQRSDDKPEVVRERLKVYKEQTLPLLDYYAKQNKLQTVSGQNSPDQVYQDLLKKLP